jgi:fimbrial isopeptide formation D2 family protein
MDNTSKSFQAYDTANVSLVEPLLNINKINNVSSVAEVGKAINYSIEVYHLPTSRSTAYDVYINDTIPLGLQFVPGSDWADPADSFAISGRNLSWHYSSLNNLTFNQANPVKLYYSVIVNNTVVMGQVLKNNATLTWTSTPGPNPDERYGGFNSLDNYNKTAISALTVKNVASDIKLPDELRSRTIGETANYTIIVSLPRAIARNLWINDTLPQGLKYDNDTLTISGATSKLDKTPVIVYPANDGKQVSRINWSFGDVNNTLGQNLTIKFNAIVADVSSNRNNVLINNNNATLSWTDFSNRVHNSYDLSGKIKVIEPLMNITKANNASSVAEVGKTINYSIEVYHLPSSQSTAYDVFINDTIPSGLNFVPGSDWADPADSFSISGRNLSWHYSSLGNVTFNQSHPVKLYYSVIVNNTVVMGQVLKNNATLTWTSTPGPNPDERYGGFNSLDNYNKTAISALTVKNVASDIKLPDEARIGLVGEEVNYTIIIDLPRANALNVWINDTLPSGLVYLPATRVITGAATAPVETVSVPNDGSQPVLVNWHFGNVNNVAGLGIQIRFNASVANISENRGGRTINNNTAALNWTDFYGVIHSESDQSGQILVPGIKVSKNPVPSEGSPSTNVNFTISVTNIGPVKFNPK